MPSSEKNISRMLQIIDEVFATRSDPDQLQVNPGQVKKLKQIHPAALTELADENGPLIWILMIPTVTDVMNDFIEGKISEKTVLERTKPGEVYNCIYLCSATTLQEYRGKGKTKSLCIQSIREIAQKHPIKTLFVWPFTKEGEKLAEAIAKECGLALLKKAAH